jgi:ABC-type branched-subunit amino acid transport system permease subunit
MFSNQFFNVHRTWEDWFGMVLGLLIAVSPMLAGGEVSRAAIWNTVLVGVLILFIAELEYAVLQRWEEICQLVLGLWLIASPYVLGYSAAGSLRFWHSTLGGLVILLAALELWQDWNRSDQDMVRRGKLFG